jgi:hypothetical protein
MTIMARIRLVRIALTKLPQAFCGTRRVALESKKIAHESLVLSLLSKFVWLGMLGWWVRTGPPSRGGRVPSKAASPPKKNAASGLEVLRT